MSETPQLQPIAEAFAAADAAAAEAEAKRDAGSAMCIAVRARPWRINAAAPPAWTATPLTG